MVKFIVQIKDKKTGEVVKKFDPSSFAIAEKVKRGVNINMDSKNFYASITPELLNEGGTK